MQVAYMKSKLFADGSEEIRIKISNEITTETINKAQTTKFFNKLDKAYKQERIINKINALKFTDKDYERKKRILEYELQLRNIQNVRRSANRARQNLYDVCKCNDFDFFVTFTYSSEYVDRLNDKTVKRKFTQWANDTRKRFPNMYYVATPRIPQERRVAFPFAYRRRVVRRIEMRSRAQKEWQTEIQERQADFQRYRVEIRLFDALRSRELRSRKTLSLQVHYKTTL